MAKVPTHILAIPVLLVLIRPRPRPVRTDTREQIRQQFHPTQMLTIMDIILLTLLCRRSGRIPANNQRLQPRGP